MDINDIALESFNPTGKYVQATTIFRDKNTDWVYVDLSMTAEQIAKLNLALWCDTNMEERWTMLGGSEFAFENGADAIMFKLQFSL